MPPLKERPSAMTGAQPRERTRDKALLIAIHYHVHPHPKVDVLDTPYKDLERLRQHLIKCWGYLPANITVMKDDDPDESMIPTRDNMLREIDNLVDGVEKHDRRVFFFAGHAYQIKSLTGTEHDGLDEAILAAKHNGPPDHAKFLPLTHEVRKGIVIDNDLRRSLVDRIPCGAKLVAIADTCHSGTLFDLNWHWRCSSKDENRLVTIPAPCGNALKRVTPRGKRVRSSNSKPSRQEHVYHAKSPSGGHPSSGSEQKNMKTLFSTSRKFTMRSGDPMDDLENGYGEMPMCSSPTQDQDPDVTSFASAEDHQLAWAKKTDTMTSVLVDLLEELQDERIKMKDLTHRLNQRMRGIRRQTFEALHRGKLKKKKYREKCAEILSKIDRLQFPQLGSLRKEAPDTVFEF